MQLAGGCWMVAGCRPPGGFPNLWPSGERTLAQPTVLDSQRMAQVAFRLIPCDDEGQPREQSQLTSIHDTAESVGVGSVIEADLFGYDRWEVVEVRDDSGGLTRATGADGAPIPLGGTLVCRGVR